MNLWISKSDFILKKKFHSYLSKKKKQNFIFSRQLTIIQKMKEI